MVKQLRLLWSLPHGSNGVSVINYADGVSNVIIRSTSRTAIGLLIPRLHTGVTVTADQEVRTIDTATGQLQQISVLGTWDPVVGTATDDPLPDVAMGLLRFQTGGIVNGHRVRGRTFIPGLTEASSTAGQVDPAALSDLTDAAVQLAAAGQMVVWSRPLKDSGGSTLRPGSAHPITASGAWGEFAVQRGRRTGE